MKPGRKPKYRQFLTLTRFDKKNDTYLRRVAKLGHFTKTDILNWEFERVRMNYTPQEFSKLLSERRNKISTKGRPGSRHAH